MDIWLIKNGEKTGPIPDYEIRSRLESGDLSLDAPAWHDGLEAWCPLREMPLFANEKQGRKEMENPVANATDQPQPSTTPSPSNPHLARRFWARWLDLYGYAAVWWFLMWAAGRNIGDLLGSSWIILSLYIPWFVIEALLIHRFGTTPGKWLLGIKVVNDDGSRLSLAQSTRRSSRVAFLGIGFGWGLLALICQVIALVATLKLGRPLWDHGGQHHLETSRVGPLRVVIYIIVFFAALQLQMSVVGPYVVDNMKKMFPAFSEQFEKNPPWHLPKNR